MTLKIKKKVREKTILSVKQLPRMYICCINH